MLMRRLVDSIEVYVRMFEQRVNRITAILENDAAVGNGDPAVLRGLIEEIQMECERVKYWFELAEDALGALLEIHLHGNRTLRRHDECVAKMLRRRCEGVAKTSPRHCEGVAKSFTWAIHFHPVASN